MLQALANVGRALRAEQKSTLGKVQDKFPDSSLCFAMNPCVHDYLIGTTALEVDIRECSLS